MPTWAVIPSMDNNGRPDDFSAPVEMYQVRISAHSKYSFGEHYYLKKTQSKYRVRWSLFWLGVFQRIIYAVLVNN